MLQPEELVGEEWAAWYRLSPAERWTESEQLWQIYFHLGGSLEIEPDTQSPFFAILFPEFQTSSPKVRQRTHKRIARSSKQ